ncbi:MAG: NAD(P)HX epimerase / NAD(P)HX dehydratase [Ignavibacteriae bacterium]|nr:MAG: NAD(P)HX epimerase / NAD(P)HX dehydratase [Ignavibacteriota bacterium]
MNPVLTPEEMRNIDRITIDSIGIPGCVLMENAGRGIVAHIIKKYGAIDKKNFLVICGKGNNGGDGFVVARYLYNLGANVTVLLLTKKEQITGDAKINFDILINILKNREARQNLKVLGFKNFNMLHKFPKFDFIVDAIFGTGFTGTLDDFFLKIVKWINSQSIPVISIDIPSGVNGTTGSVENDAVKSNLTVTMGFKKTGLLIGNSVNYIEDLKLVDISIPRFLSKKFKFKTYEVTLSDIRNIFPVREKTAHKYSVGKVLVLAGSVGYTGASALTSLSAIKTGAGAVILGTPDKVYPILARKLTEVMVFPLDSTKNGSLSLNSYEKIQKHLKWADVLAIGPGISTNDETAELVIKIIYEFGKKIVIDADAITILSNELKILKRRKSKQLIITPHMGEFSRLTRSTVEEIEKNKFAVSREFAKKFNLVLVLKGAPTITVTPDNRVYINSTGNPGMATAGSGDVLSGIISGLFAQGLNAEDASIAGVYLHGLAGDIAKLNLGIKSLTATDIQKYIPDAIKLIERGKYNC